MQITLRVSGGTFVHLSLSSHTAQTCSSPKDSSVLSLSKRGSGSGTLNVDDVWSKGSKKIWKLAGWMKMPNPCRRPYSYTKIKHKFKKIPCTYFIISNYCKTKVTTGMEIFSKQNSLNKACKCILDLIFFLETKLIDPLFNINT